MKFEWDEQKRLINLQRHGIDFVGISEVFDDLNALTVLDDRFDYCEVRFITFGSLNGRIVSVVHTETDEIIRIFQLEKQRKMNKSNTTNKSETDWARIDAMKDEDIDFSDNPKVTPEMFARGVRRNQPRTDAANGQVALAVDRDVIEFFKSQGQNYPQKINQLLRAYMEAQQAK